MLLVMLAARNLPGLDDMTCCQCIHSLIMLLMVTPVSAPHLRTLDKGMLSLLTAFC